MKKIIFTDIDGTVLSHRTNSVPQSTLQTIQELHKEGILIFGCTGRHRSLLRTLPLDDLNLDGWITMNGAYCYMNDQVIFQEPISKDDIHILVENVSSDPFPVQFFEADSIYLNMYSAHLISSLAAIHTIPSPTRDLKECIDHDIYMMIPWAEESRWKLLYAKMKHVKAVRWNPYAVDCFAKDCGKDRGVTEVLKYLHLAKEDAAAIGDAENDLAMFDACGTSIAMGNASDTVKNKADYITDDIDKDGWANALSIL